MTAINFSIEDWTSTVLGKLARAAIAVLGIITASLTLMLAPLVAGASWMMLLAGIALAATTVRAARDPNLARLTSVAANLIVIPLLMRIG